jgi:hypothetical protein
MIRRPDIIHIAPNSALRHVHCFTGWGTVMLKLGFVCAVACSSSMTAFAGERSIAPSGIKVLAARAMPSRAIPIRTVTARATPLRAAIPLRALPRAEAAPVPAHAAIRFVLPLAKRATYDIGAPSAPVALLATGYVRPATNTASAFALPQPQPQPAWRLTGKSPEVTARAGGRYAVGEGLADHRRVGPPRSALDAIFVLRIDGRDDSPPLSMRGGVVGAMWRAGTTPSN